MKIAFILSRSANLGPFIVAKDIINNVYDKLDSVDVFYIKEGKDNLKFVLSPTKISFWKSICFSDYDIIHSHGFLADAYVGIHKKKNKFLHITTLHQRILPDYSFKYNRLFGFFFEKLWLSFFDSKTIIVTLTNEMARYYRHSLKDNHISYIYNGISISATQKEIPDDDIQAINNLKEKYKIIGIAANLIYRKGIDQVISAISRSDQYALAIIGDGKKRNELLNMAKKLDVSDRVLFLGYKKEALAYFKYFDVYVMSSRSEGFGLCVIEAASQKLPIVCSNIPEYNEIFEKDEVVRFKLEDITSLLNSINHAFENYSVLSEKAYDRYHNSFTAKIMADNYLNLYREVLNR